MKKNGKTNSQKSGVSSWLFPLAVLAAAVTVGVVLGGLTSDSGSQPVAAPAAAEKPAAAAKAAAPQVPSAPAEATISRIKLDLNGAPAYGPENAPITLVEFTDYQCPFCRRAHTTLNQVKQKYGDKVRLVYLQNPLSFHKDAPMAAKAALAAGEQNRFREMHDLLLNGTSVQRDVIMTYAQSLGLDMDAFTAALDSTRFDSRIQQDQAQAQRIGASATPFFFINGRAVRGAQPLAAFEAIIDEELAGNLAPTKWVATAAPPRSNRPAEDPNKIYEVDVAQAISRGPEDAPVTLVEFTAFQCGFCGRSQATITKILENYPGKVRHVVMYKPLRDAKAAIASLAANRQGKYWEYRDLLWQNQRALTDENMRLWAQQLGLDLAQFDSDVQDPALAKVVQDNSRQAGSLRVSGTPTFFINGKKLVGAQPYERFKAIIDEQLAATS